VIDLVSPDAVSPQLDRGQDEQQQQQQQRLGRPENELPLQLSFASQKMKQARDTARSSMQLRKGIILRQKQVSNTGNLMSSDQVLFYEGL
jgi:hypothetical protein